jgi:hypothetical protein
MASSATQAARPRRGRGRRGMSAQRRGAARAAAAGAARARRWRRYRASRGFLRLSPRYRPAFSGRGSAGKAARGRERPSPGTRVSARRDMLKAFISRLRGFSKLYGSIWRQRRAVERFRERNPPCARRERAGAPACHQPTRLAGRRPRGGDVMAREPDYIGSSQTLTTCTEEGLLMLPCRPGDGDGGGGLTANSRARRMGDGGEEGPGPRRCVGEARVSGVPKRDPKPAKRTPDVVADGGRCPLAAAAGRQGRPHRAQTGARVAV